MYTQTVTQDRYTQTVTHSMAKQSLRLTQNTDIKKILTQTGINNVHGQNVYSGLTANCTHPDLNEEVSQMFLKCRNVLVKAEQTLDE